MDGLQRRRRIGTRAGGVALAVAVATVLGGLATLVPSGAAQHNLAPGRESPASAGVPASPPSPAAGTATGPSSLLAQLPASLRSAPWVEQLAGTNRTPKPLTSLPNLQLLEHGTPEVDGEVGLPYVAQPAPLGLADYGLGPHPYTYSAPRFLGQLRLNSPPNATDPGATDVIEPGGAAQGYVGSVYEFGVQLNTIATNILLPNGSGPALWGYFWTQNVVDWNDSGLHFVSDTFNLTEPVNDGPSGVVEPGTIASGCNNSSAGVDRILTVYGGVLQCVGGTIPVSPAAYPVTLQLYNTLSINAQNRTVLAFGYTIDESGTDAVYSGTSDTVVFNTPTAPALPQPRAPGFSVNGTAATPLGLLQDSEIDVVGDIGGDNAVFRSFNGTLNLEYSNASTNTSWQNVPSAFNFGSDTGETSTGLADYWLPNDTLVVHQGPSLLYGLWNATIAGSTSSSVSSGAVHLEGTISPAYGFAFLATTANDKQYAWLPTNDTGGFDTYLPPLGAPTRWASGYWLTGFADGFARKNGTEVVGNVTNYNLTLTSSPATLNAPLYMFSGAQAASLAGNITPSAAPPYTFSNLSLDVNITFNHLNDYLYPTFELVMAQGVTQPIVVQNLLQGPDAPHLGYDYVWDGSTVPNASFPSLPSILSGFTGFTSQINLYGGTSDVVENQSLVGTALYTGLIEQGGEIVLWGDTDAVVAHVTSTDGSQGVFVGDSTGSFVTDLVVDEGYGVQDFGSTGTTVNNVTGDDALGVEAFSSSHGSYTNISLQSGSEAVAAGEDFGASDDFDLYYDFAGVTSTAVYDVTALGSYGVNLTLSDNDSVSGIYAAEGAIALGLDRDQNVTVANVAQLDGAWPISASYSANLTFTNVTVHYGDIGIQLYWVNDTTISAAKIYGETSAGILLVGSSDTISGGLVVDCASYAVAILLGTGTVVDNNAFLGDDGSSYGFSPAHVQAYTVAGNSFDSAGDVGNYWSDWHTAYPNGTLEPYLVANGVADLYPLLRGPGTVAVTFVESGLPAGKAWSFALAGVGGLTTNSSVTLDAPNGSWAYLLHGPAGWELSGLRPAANLTVAGANLTETFHFVRGRTVTATFTESGLPRGQPWCVTFTTMLCSERATIVVKNLTPASGYPYVIVAIAGYYQTSHLGREVVLPSGSLDLAGPATIHTKFTQVTYAVIFLQDGLPPGKHWTVRVTGEINGHLRTETKGGSSLALIEFALPNGTFNYTVVAPRGYVAQNATGNFTVDGAGFYEVANFTPEARAGSPGVVPLSAERAPPPASELAARPSSPG